jgi:phosphatidylglycerophosphatase C
MPNKVAVFDFDETLVLENSLGFLFQNVACKTYWIAAIPAIAKSILCCNFGHKLRLSVKQALYKKYLTGASENRVYVAGTETAARLTVNTNAMNELDAANDRGDTVVIATASPRIYVTAILDELKIDRFKVIGTEIDFDAGLILGEECSREAKWIAVTKELQGLPSGETIAYGNAPDDLYMLAQVDKGFVVKGPSIRQYSV